MLTLPIFSRSRPRPAPHWPPWLASAPTLVAEALVAVDDPLSTIVRLEPVEEPARVVGAIARAVAPREAAVTPPAWLFPEQVAPFRRSVAALERHGGALLADPVGSGKSWIALAVAQALQRREPAVAIVPAILLPQWAQTAERAGVPLTLLSHDAVSRGRLPPAGSGVVLIDEAHRFRHPETRRYRHVAPWLLGQRTLLLTGTPVVNRLDDLVHQLLLVVPDDTLRPRGVASLRAALRTGIMPPALGDLVFRRALPAAQPTRRLHELAPPLAPAEGELLTAIDRLQLSRDRGIAALIRLQLWRALASSPAALGAALQRLLHLLMQARAAHAAGRRLTRGALLTQLGDAPEQLLLWGVLPDSGGTLDLRLTDADAVRRLVDASRRVPTTPRMASLLDLLADPAPTLVFTTSRPTLTLLRDVTAARRPAWVSGERAGIGRTALPRRTVLEWFGQTPPSPPAGLARPTLLLATDVAAEGLDLQRIARVIHWDLPWTSVRLDQREGRARRLGASVTVVDTVRYLPAPELERRLHQAGRIAMKRQLGDGLGLGDDQGWAFRWRAELGERFGGDATHPGIVAVDGTPAGWLVALSLLRLPDEAHESAELYWLDDDGSVTDRPERVVPMLHAAVGATRLAEGAPCRRALQRALLPFLRERMQATSGDAWLDGETAMIQRQALGRLRRLGRDAARLRDARRMALLERGLRWLGGGLRAGELQLLESAMAEGSGALVGLIAQRAPADGPPRAAPMVLLPRIAGIVRVGSFQPCHPSAPCCSTSTAPSSTASP